MGRNYNTFPLSPRVYNFHFFLSSFFLVNVCYMNIKFTFFFF